MSTLGAERGFKWAEGEEAGAPRVSVEDREVPREQPWIEWQRDAACFCTEEMRSLRVFVEPRGGLNIRTQRGLASAGRHFVSVCVENFPVWAGSGAAVEAAPLPSVAIGFQTSLLSRQLAEQLRRAPTPSPLVCGLRPREPALGLRSEAPLGGVQRRLHLDRGSLADDCREGS